MNWESLDDLKEEMMTIGKRIVIMRLLDLEYRGVITGYSSDILIAIGGNRFNDDIIKVLKDIVKKRIEQIYYYNDELFGLMREYKLINVQYEDDFYVITDRIAEVTSQGRTYDDARMALSECLQLYYEED